LVNSFRVLLGSDRKSFTSGSDGAWVSFFPASFAAVPSPSACSEVDRLRFFIKEDADTFELLSFLLELEVKLLCHKTLGDLRKSKQDDDRNLEKNIEAIIESIHHIAFPEINLR